MRIVHLKFRFVFLFLFLVGLSSCRGGELLNMRVGEHVLKVEIAQTPEQRSLGLMDRRSLSANQGMLFVFRTPHRPSFWMKDTLIPLSIAFISSDGIIKQIEDMWPRSLVSVPSRYRVLYALEVNRGWFQEKGIKPGDRVQLPDNLPDRK